MSALLFPENPLGGELYPPGAGEPGKIQWEYDSDSETWRIVPSGLRTGAQSASNDYVWPDEPGEENYFLKRGEGQDLTWHPEEFPSIVHVNLLEDFNGERVEFTIQENGEDFSPSPPSNIITFVGGVPQTYGTSYTILGSQITFSEAPPSGALFYGFSTKKTAHLG
jgi:hypothetical protein